MAAKDSSKARAATPPTPPPRRDGPRGIATLIAPVVRPALRRRGAALAALVADWVTIVGPEMAARSQPLKFAAGTLTVGCAGPDALEFQHRAPALIARINLALGGAPVVRLRFADLPAAPQPRPPQARHGARSGGQAHRLPPDLPDGPMGEALARLHAGLSQAAGKPRR